MARAHCRSVVSQASNASSVAAGLSRQDSFDELEAEAHWNSESNWDSTIRRRQPERVAHTKKTRNAPEAVLLPFQGQVRVATRASKVLKEKTSIGALCCVTPRTGELVLFADDLTQILCVPLEYVTLTVLRIANDTTTETNSDASSCILHVEVDTNEPSSSFFIAPASRAAAEEWALLLSRCKVPVFGSRAHSTAAETDQNTRGIQERQRRNALNGSRPLVYWIKD